MTNNNNKTKVDLPCAFAETLVAVLYDEATDAERRKVQLHLADCESCSEELAAFGAVRNAVGEWREAEFLPLATPEIILPTVEKPVVVETEKTSWLANLREFLFPATGGWQSATALATLAICAALIAVFGFLMLNTSNDIVANANTKKSPVVEASPSVEPDEKVIAKVNPTPTPQEIKQKPSNPTPVENSIKPNPRPAVQRASTEVKKPAKKSAVKKSQTPDDIDLGFDDSLEPIDDGAPRLADLLDEVLPSDE